MVTAHSALQPDREAMAILVVGADGVIGGRLARVLAEAGRSVIGTTRRATESAADRIHFDLASADGFDALPLCRAAVLCAAVTSMEYCQKDPEATRQINVTNTVRLARHLLAAGSHVVFLSSNTVFDGRQPWARATDSTSPRTEYGRQKADAESQLLSLGGQIAVVRFSKIIPPEMPLLQGWVRDMRSGRSIYPFSDSRMSPVSLSFAVELLRRVLEMHATGIIQASAASDISYEQAARYLARRLGCDEQLIEPISCVQRGIEYSPANTTLDPTGLAALGLEAPQVPSVLDELVFPG
uniref:sugar nucleotide-binding protein n=1 Tax=Hylemonella sp. TaxID=2066020 RepID=UPI0035B1BD75